MLNNKKLISNTILYSIGEVVPRILSFILLPILTVYLTTKEYGINSYTTSVMTFIFVITSLSLNTYLLSQFHKEKNDEDRKDLVGTIFYFILFFNVLLLIIQFFLFPILIDYFKVSVPFHPFFSLAILNNFFDVIAIIPLVLYRVKEDAKGFILVSLSRTILQYILILLLVVYYKQGLEGSYYGRLIANIPFIFVYFYYIRKNGNFKINFNIVRKAFVFSLPLLPGSISYILIGLSDRIILERYISLEKIGIYSVAFTLALALNVVIQALYKTIEPIIFKAYNEPEFQSVNLTLYQNYLCLLFIGGFSVALYGKEIFILATSSKFLIGYKIVPFLVVSVVISGINIYLDLLLIACSKQKIVSYTTVLSGIVSVMINLLLIPYIGYYGAIIASITAFLVVNVICQFNVYLKKKYFFSQVTLIFAIITIPYLYEYFLELENIIVDIFLKLLIVVFFSFIATISFGIDIGKLKKYYIKIF